MAKQQEVLLVKNVLKLGSMGVCAPSAILCQIAEYIHIGDVQ